VRAGEFFGELAPITNLPRVATVTAMEPVHAPVIRDVESRTLEARTPQIAVRPLGAVAKRLPTAAEAD